MRTRFLALGAAMALALGLLTAAPAKAAYAVDAITFPDGTSTFYSPFAGPATVTFSWDVGSSDAMFELRLRPIGGSAIHREPVFIDPDTQASPREVEFSWPRLSVASARTYQVAVYRNDVLQGQPESFQLRPPLASITRATPNTFFPWIDDGYRDTTRVRFTLAEDADAEARVFRPRSTGACCGALVRNESLSNLPAGDNDWIWDGRGEGGFAGNLAKGDYFVRIRADDGSLPAAISKPFKVAIARTYRASATKSKPGTARHHTIETSTVRGGDCFVHALGGFLQVDCHGGRMTVFYRWGLGSGQRIERASFVIDDPNNECGPARRRTSHSKHESSITVTDSVSGITSCRVVTAKITYSFLKNS
jgi:hypothetical protein